MIYGTPVARSAEPSRAQAAPPTGLPFMPPRPSAGVLVPQRLKPKTRTGKGVAGVAALVLLGAALGYALHESLDLLLSG
jgi:hypothetical protein